VSTLDVAAVIVTADTRELVLECVASLPPGRLRELVVVDNGSRDGTAEALEAVRPDVHVERIDPPVGFASACNVGAARSQSPGVLFMNSDILVPAGSAEALYRRLSESPDAVAAGGRLVDPGTLATQVAYRPRTFPGAFVLSLQALGVERVWPGNPFLAHHLGAGLPDRGTVEVDQPAAACLLVRRTALDATGGFDEGFTFWFEDVDLALRLQAHGKLLYVADAPFEHVGGASFDHWDHATVIRARYHGLLRYARAHLRSPSRQALGMVLAASLVTRSFRARGEPRAALREAARNAGLLAVGR